MYRPSIKVINHEYHVICLKNEVQKIQELSKALNQSLKKLNIDLKKFLYIHAFLTLDLILLDEIQKLKSNGKVIFSMNNTKKLNEFLRNLLPYTEKIKKAPTKLEDDPQSKEQYYLLTS